MSDIFSEVDDAIREDQWRELWRRFGGYVIGAALAIVIGVAGNQFWQSYEKQQREDAAILYLSGLRALDENKQDAALGQFAKLSDSGHDGYAALARHEQASGLLREDKIAESIALLDSIADDRAIADDLRAIASIKAVLLAMDTEEQDAVNARLAPLAKTGEPYEHLARELQAATALKYGALETARAAFQALVTDPLSPYGVRQRSLEMMALLGPADQAADAASDTQQEDGENAE